MHPSWVAAAAAVGVTLEVSSARCAYLCLRDIGNVPALHCVDKEVTLIG